MNETQIKITDELNKTDLENKNEANEKQNQQEENKDLATEIILEKSTNVEESMEMDLDKLTSIEKTTNQTEGNAEDTPVKLTDIPETSDDQAVNNEMPDKDSNQLKEAKDSNEILLDKDKSIQEETNCVDTNKTDIETCQTVEHEDKEANKTEDKDHEEPKITKDTLEKDLELNTNTDDSITTNKEEKVTSSETLPKGQEPESETNDNESYSQSLQGDLNIVLRYSSAEELEKSDIETEKLTVASVKSEDNHEGTDSDTRHLKNLCLTKNVKVLVRKLRAADLTSLRQPKVKIRRVSYEKYAEEFRNKRRRITGKGKYIVGKHQSFSI